MADLYKPEYEIILNMIKKGSSVLDLGCGDGELLALIRKNREIVKAQGIEIDEKAIYKCVERGLSVFHGDIDSGLAEYDDNSFDYVILNQTFQQVKKPDIVLGEAIRGRAPITRSLPYEWYDTPNIHFLSISDFIDYCNTRKIVIEKSIYLGKEKPVRVCPNLRALLGIFMITKNRNS